MAPHSLKGYSERDSQILWEDDERVLRRGWRLDAGGNRCATLFVVPAAEHPSRSILAQFRREYALKDELNAAWAVCPLELAREAGRTMLVLEDPGGEPLDRLLAAPMEMGRFLRLAVGVAAALAKLHQRGLVHKDIKPTHILANDATGEVRLTGFGIASRVARERQLPQPPETLAGTLAYMAPEQTGRMNRSVDSRSDLYALGVMFYQMLTGVLPFSATEPMEWVHCHVARRPLPPVDRLKGIPAAVSAIVMRLLEKRAEDRYQTAAGLERDLRRCHAEWEAQRRVEDFSLGGQDTPEGLLIPEKLYGRQQEVETLLASFARIVKGGVPELVLVSGYSGIGKSSVVNELQPVLVPPRGLFASGKFDQYKRDIPYSTLAQAFKSLTRPLLGKSEAELAPWRDALREKLGPNAGLIVDIVPEVKLIIGEPPAVPELPPQDAQRRFQLVLRNFIGVFARADHPLALFLDDLQWLDAATLDVLEYLLTRSDLKHLMLIGAYRDNEVTVAHPLVRKLQAIRAAGGKVEDITLGPLTPEHLRQMMADALRCELGRSAPLAQLVHDKTGGNPFFAIQFIQSLAEERLLALDHETSQWSWDLDRIRRKGYTDNVVQLMAGRISRLPIETLTALQHLACLGNVAEISMYSIALECSEEQVDARLWTAVRLELVERREGSYKFIHDRVQEAAYSLIPEEQRAEAHLRIGRLLATHIAPEKRDEAVFEIVNQLNRGAALITRQEERDQLAELDLSAGKRAKASTAYASALKFLTAGAALLGEDGWKRRRDLMFALELGRAECELLTGELTAADERLVALSDRAVDTIERATLASLHMGVCTELIQSDRAIAVALDYLRRVGVEISPHPTEQEVRLEYEQIFSQLGGRSIEEVADFPLMRDPETIATVGVLTKMHVPAILTDPNLDGLAVCRAVNLSLQRGNCDASCLAYVTLGRVAVQRFGDYKTAFQFGQVSHELVEHRGLKRFEAATYVCLAALISPWMKHVRTSADLSRRGFDAANTIGDLTYANYANVALNADLLVAGDPLSEVQREVEAALTFAQKTRFSGDTDLIIPQCALVRTLRGSTRKFGCFDSEQIEELPFEAHLAGNRHLGIHECWYWIRKMQARYFADDYIGAMEASSKAKRLIWLSNTYIEEAEFHFYSALSISSSLPSAVPDEGAQHLEALARHLGQLETWARNCPENFENRAALVGAEIARIEGRDLDAMHLYEKAIRSSRANGFVHNEALACERASAFYRFRGFEEFSEAYLRRSHACYTAWGADGKVRQLLRLHPGLKQKQPSSGRASSIAAPVEGLQLATVVRVLQAISGEIVLERLLETTMRMSMEHAGADRGVLIVPRDDELRVAAESRTEGSEVIVWLQSPSAETAATAESILRYVKRTHESVILDDASAANAFSADPYFRQSGVRSILCLPLLNRARLEGILYLENKLAARVFAPERIAVLKVLVSQAAISLENTRLYRDLQDRDAKIRHLVDANILGIFVWDLGGAIIEANDAFLRTLQYSREDLVSRPMSWMDMTPVDSRERDDRAFKELRQTGTVQPYEKEFLRKDGSRAPVLIGAAAFDEQRDQGVAFVLDLTARKCAEDALQLARAELAQATRVMTLNALTTSIAHEVNQPLAGIITNASTCLRMLDANPPNVSGARETARRTLRDGNRASDIVRRLRALFGKKDLTFERVDLNEAAREVLAFSRADLQMNRVVVRLDLDSACPVVTGDRVQLQQVILNMVRNGSDAMVGVEDRARELVIRTERDGSDQVRLSVIDAGVGLDRGVAAKLFEAFYTTKTDRMGIGLSISRSIIEAHHGRLWATANAGSGATFCFSMPCESRPN